MLEVNEKEVCVFYTTIVLMRTLDAELLGNPRVSLQLGSLTIVEVALEETGDDCPAYLNTTNEFGEEIRVPLLIQKADLIPGSFTVTQRVD